jgi:GDP-L-fucose synthase
MWGTGSAKRELLYVDDCADACVFLLENYNKSQFINVGTGEDVSIAELATMVKEIVGYTGEIVWDTTKPDGMPRKVLDVSKINEMGWKHTINLKDGLVKTYEWYLKNVVGGKK